MLELIEKLTHTMWPLFLPAIFMVQFAAVSGTCTMEEQTVIINCMQSLQSFMTANTPEEQVAACTESRQALECLTTGLKTCPELQNDQLEATIQFLDRPINAMCPDGSKPPEAEVVIPEIVGGDVSEEPPLPVRPVEPTGSNTLKPDKGPKCRRKDKKTMRKCANKLKIYAKQSPMKCGKIDRALTCISNLMGRCQSSFSPKRLQRLGAIRENVLEICVEGPEEVMIEPPAPEPPIEELPDETSINAGSLCPDTYMFDLQQCASDLAQMSGALGGGHNIQEACRMFNEAMSCIDNIVENCKGRPGISEVAAGLSGGHMDTVTSLCRKDEGPVMIEPPAPEAPIEELPDETSINAGSLCPDTYMFDLQQCASDLAQFSAALMDSYNIQGGCRYEFE